MQASTSDGNESPKRPWSDLPYDLLAQIVNLLLLVDLLCFRGVCKDWRCASFKASAKCTIIVVERLWFLLYGDNLHCTLYNPLEERKYTMNIPELDGMTCIASLEGWLLVYGENSLFFFCPFSRAKINLPQFPHNPQQYGHVAVFTSAPTSPDCTVGIICHIDESTMELNLLRRGDNKWDTQGHALDVKIGNIIGATFNKGMFYFLDSVDLVLGFVIGDKKWHSYVIVKLTPLTQSVDKLPFGIQRNHFQINKLKEKLGLDEGDAVYTCGTIVQSNHQFNQCIHNEELKAKGEMKMRRKGVYLQPRFFQIPPNQSWSL
ncbi:hypothetical protein GIB67_034464 [Kingdonia uniflora]|uniref:F-box protein n=1 Tax=Kingdonia uniflora TaxID=39325 RepID=A0A7J7PBE9_9MAGN|nr:hypothetical protein GIB67_034464 [Kingdonia uniflora]